MLFFRNAQQPIFQCDFSFLKMSLPQAKDFPSGTGMTRI
jgi:hypothetical protein